MQDEECLNSPKQNMCWAPCLNFEYSLADLNFERILKNNWRMKIILDEPPCRASMNNSGNERMIERKRSWKHKVKPCDEHYFLSSFSFVSFGHACAVCPSIGLFVVSGGCYINIAGRKPFSYLGEVKNVILRHIMLIGHGRLGEIDMFIEEKIVFILLAFANTYGCANFFYSR